MTDLAYTNNHDELLELWLEEGFKFRMKANGYMREHEQEYRDRIAMELGVIKAKEGYTDYFLMCSDLVRWAKDHGILVGPGRGSAAGSLACYLLRITEIDAMQYPVMFERFLDPLRTDPPDVDIDFEDERREEVIEYARRKYGTDRVANILTFTKYRGRNSLDDIARVYHVPTWKIEQIKEQLIDRAEGHPRFADTIVDAFDKHEALADMLEDTEGLNYAQYLEGNIRNASIHPCGIVIAGTSLENITATYTKESGAEHGSGVAYDKKDGEYLGLLKVDFLSLTTLTGIRAALDAIGMSIKEFYEIPLDDPKVFEAFRKGDLLGIFQFEGGATRRVTKLVSPTKFMDLVDINALSRPGGDDTAYLNNKKLQESGAGLDLGAGSDEGNAILEEHLGWTFGTIVYQEQIMLVLRDLGNFPPADVNAVRKAISAKLDPTKFNVYLENWIEGCKSHGVPRDNAMEIWSHIVDAAGYGFNISHAVSYSDTAYRQMWLKIYHPEFYLGQLIKNPDSNEDRRRRLIVEAEAHGIEVVPPRLGLSKITWTLDKSVKAKPRLIAGWTEIKGIGIKNAQAILDWQENRVDDMLPLLVGLPDAPRESLAGMEDAARQGLEFGWDDLLEVPGIGPGRVQTIREFCEHSDPFGTNRIRRMIDKVRNAIEAGELPDVAMPTHDALELINGNDGDFVVFAGVPKERHYKDVVEQRLKYGGSDLTYEQVVDSLDSPHFRKYANLLCMDEFDEPVWVRISRKKFPQYERLVKAAKLNRDVVVAKGFISNFNGLAVQISEIAVIQLDP